MPANAICLLSSPGRCQHTEVHRHWIPVLQIGFKDQPPGARTELYASDPQCDECVRTLRAADFITERFRKEYTELLFNDNCPFEPDFTRVVLLWSYQPEPVAENDIVMEGERLRAN